MVFIWIVPELKYEVELGSYLMSFNSNIQFEVILTELGKECLLLTLVAFGHLPT